MALFSDVIIIGAGLAGLTSAIHLSRSGLKVTVIEKNDFPKHKVCGEYISNEIRPYLESLTINLNELEPVNITEVSISTVTGKEIFSELPLGGFGISRYSLDMALYEKAIESGCKFVRSSASEITFENGGFTIKTTDDSEFHSAVAIGAFGKRSVIDQKMNRGFILKKSPWLAVKAHYLGSFPNNLVSLHAFQGGYCGVSKVENEIINICYLADYATFKKYKDIEQYQQEVLKANPKLKKIFEDCRMVFEKPLSISQVSFEKKLAVEDHILMAGDSAGLIHPLCGNGMAMAIHSAKIASELVIEFSKGKISRLEMETRYAKLWKFHFSRRIRMGRVFSAFLRNKQFSSLAMELLTHFPGLFRQLIQSTHGKPITVN